MKNDKELLNRKVGAGGGKSVKGKSDDAGAQGYHKSEFGGNENENYRIEDGYESKDESPSRNEGTKVQEICHHSVTGELYSGDPGKHGHMGKSGG